jgi:hypothetical protein
MLLLPEETAQAVLAGLGDDFGGSGIHYWLVPAIAQGRLV